MSEQAAHKFELAGLGKAPFRFIGYEHKTYQAHPSAPVQVGGSCDYCGTGISNMYHVQSADGKRFKVGSYCIAKVDDKGLQKVVAAQVAKARKEKTAQKNAAVKEALAQMLPKVEAALKAQPHPFPNYAAAGKTMWDSVTNRLSMCGAAGRAELLKELKSVGASAPA